MPPRRKSFRKPPIRQRFHLERLEERTVLSSFFVSLNGSDAVATTGTATDPFRTIQHAIDETAAADALDDTISVEAGVYQDPTHDLAISVPNSGNINNLQILGGFNAGTDFTTGRTPRSTVYVPQQAGNVVAADVDVFANNVTIDGFSFVFDGTIGVGGNRQSAGVFSRGDTFTLNNNLIEVGSSSAAGVFDAYGFQTIFGNANNGTITLTRNEFQADALHASGAIYLNPGTATSIEVGGAGVLGNVITGSNLSQGIAVDSISNVTVRGNTITRTGPATDIGFQQLIFAGPFSGAVDQTNITIQGNILEGGRSDGVTNDVGIEVGNTSGNGLNITNVSITGNEVQDNRVGILLTPNASTVTIDGNSMGRNAAGLVIFTGVTSAPTITNNDFGDNLSYQLRDLPEVLGGATVYGIFSGVGGNHFLSATAVTNGAGTVQSTTSLNIRRTIQQSIDDASNGDTVEVSGDTINNLPGIYNDPVNVNKQLAALHFIGDAEIGGAVTLSEDLLITSEAAVNLRFTATGTIDGNQDLTVNVRGTTEFNGRIGNATPLATLTTDSVVVSGETHIGTDVINAQGGTIIFNDPVILTSDTVITGSGATGVFFNNTVDSDGTPRALTVNAGGTTAFGDGGADHVGLVSALASVETDASGTTQFNITPSNNATPSVRTTGDQTYRDDATVLANTTLTAATGSVTLSGNVTGASSLTVNAGVDVTLASVNIGGALTANVDTDANGSNTLTAGVLSATAVTISGSGTNETFTLNGAVTATAAQVSIQNAASVDINADVTAATDLTVANVGTEVDLAAGVDLTATNGNVAANAGVTAIDLSGAAGINAVTAGGSVNLAAVSDSGTPAEFEVNSGTNMTLASVNITNLLDLNLDTGADSSATLTAGNLQAGTITADGQGTNDTFQFNGTVISTVAGTTLNQANQINLVQDVTAATNLTITNVNTEVDLAAGVDLTATNGNVAANAGVTAIDLSGAAGINTVSASGLVNLAAVADSGTPAEFEVNSGTNMTLASVNIANLLDLNLDTGADSSATLTAGNLQAGTITADGQGTNDTFQFNGTVTSTAASTSLNQANQINLVQDVTAATNLTITNVNTEVDLAAGVDLAATNGNVAANAGVTAIDLSGAAGINTVSASGLVTLAAVADSGTPAEFEVNSGTNMTLVSVNIANLLDLNLDTGADNAATLTAGSLTAGSITADGQALNDTMQFNGPISSTTASVAINQASQMNFTQDVSAATALTIQNATQVDLAGNVDLVANNGPLNAATGVGGINLSGSAATSTTIDGNGDAAVNLGPISSANVANLTITSEGGVDLSSVATVNTILSVTSDTDHDTTAAMLIDQSINARQVTITVNENDAVAAGGSDLTIASSVVSAAGDTVLNAGDNVTIVLGALVQAPTGSVHIKGGFGGDSDNSGTVISVDGTVTASASVTADGDAHADLFVISKTNLSSPFAVDCQGGNADIAFIRPQDNANPATCETILSAPGNSQSVQKVNVPGGTLDVTTLGLPASVLNAGLFIFGNTGDEDITGGPGPDTIFGLTGNDTIRGAGGDDKIFGDEGNDDLDGGDDKDFLEGFTGNDTLRGGAGDDTLLDLTDGNDSIIGGAGNDILAGGPGNDFQQGDSGDDLLLDGALFVYSIEIQTTDPKVIGYSEGGGNDTMLGGAGNDTLNGGAGNDDLDGGDNDDLIVDVQSQFRVTRQNGANDDLLEKFHTRFVNGAVEVLKNPVTTGEHSRRTVVTTAIGRPDLAGAIANQNDTLRGGSGNDTLAGGSGADSLDGQGGNDVVIGSLLADEHTIASARVRDVDALLGGGYDAGVYDGNDTVVGGSGSDILVDFSGQTAPLQKQDATDIVIDSFSRKGFNLFFKFRERIMGTSVRAKDLRASDIQDLNLVDPNGGILGNALSEIFVRKKADGSLDRDSGGKLIRKGSLGSFLQTTVGIGPLGKTKAGRVDITPVTIDIGIKVPNPDGLTNLRSKLRGSD
jgi:Ca2+-binding RTX toxin-like protein